MCRFYCCRVFLPLGVAFRRGSPLRIGFIAVVTFCYSVRPVAAWYGSVSDGGVVLYKSWAILVSRMLRKWWSLVRSVRNRDGVILLLYACFVYFDCEYCGCYCFVRGL